MTTKYERGNQYAEYVSLADAAVQWQSLTPEQKDSVLISDEGLPTLLNCPELHQRAEGILIAIQHGQIKGNVHNEDGYFYRPEHMKLDRQSVAAWIEKTDKRLELDKTEPMLDTDGHSIGMLEKLLTKDEVCVAINVSRATLDRMRKKGVFPEHSHMNPNRWLASEVAAYITTKVISSASGDLSQESTDKDDI